MTRTYFATLSALLFGMGYLGSMIWALNQADGVTFYRQLHPLWSVLILFVCFASLQPLIPAEFTHWLVREVSGNGRWTMRPIPIGFVSFGLVLLVGVQAPFWLVTVTLIPFTLAFVFPGFAFPPVAAARDIDWDTPSLAPTRLHWLGLVAIAVLLIAAWFPSQFYSTNARGAGGFNLPGYVIVIAVGGVFQILQKRQARHVPLLPMIKLQEKRWKVVWFQAFYLWIAFMSYMTVFLNFAPYLFTKTMGDDRRQHVQVLSREWEPDQHSCKGKVVLFADNLEQFELCFEEEGGLPGFTPGTPVDMTVRQSYAGFYISNMAVVDTP